MQYGGERKYVSNELKDLIVLGQEAQKTFKDVEKRANVLFGDTSGSKGPKEGDKKTEAGKDFIFKGGKWELIPVSETPAQRKKREDAEKKAKQEQEKLNEDYDKSKIENLKQLQQEELDLLRSKTEDKIELLKIEYKEALRIIERIS